MENNDLSENRGEMRPPFDEGRAWFVQGRATKAPFKERVRRGAERKSERERENLHRRSREGARRSQSLRHAGIVVCADIYRQNQKRTDVWPRRCR